MAASTSQRPRVKRPYQPSISSYFHHDASDPTKLERRAHSSSTSPPLPADTQASLLSVGMRVRKSIPEGYKTHKTVGASGFPFPSSAPTTSLASMPSNYRSGRGGVEGLQPFCGLHKTGGLAQQQNSRRSLYSPPPSSAPAVMARMQDEEDDDSEMPSLSASRNTTPSFQSICTSTVSSTAEASKKRTFEEDIEDAMDAYFDGHDAHDADMAASRTIAKPRAKLRRGADNVVIAGTDSDFEEAEFLAPMDVDGGLA